MKKKKMIPNKLAPEVYRALENVVGREWISQDRAIVETYSKFSLDTDGFLKKHEKDPSNIPACIVLPGSTDEVQSIVRVANRYNIPFVPFTNGQAWSGSTSPDPTICVHLSRMNRVLSIDEHTMTATLEAYADYAQLIDSAKQRKEISSKIDTSRIVEVVTGINTLYIVYWVNGSLKNKEECIERICEAVKHFLHGIGIQKE